ncbi:hypothetical protein TOPH_07670 [Tolypocladium ophioglossoides CBS 100239]|uniref:Uncharacterized protein n=1 Tax=Tolypocladium ophioglossoides (strain CBS 100239) TaxID=1163406 RepID=A0A0L0N0X9_TOLOC|nr:hypothetical protein TOPH_07670 [Tolypocladium ophioglossoides CBS 100239]
MPSTTAAPGSRALRRICLFGFPLGFVLLLVHGIVSRKVVPALGLVPMAGSALLGALLVYREKKARPVQGVLAFVVFVADVALALMHLGMLIPTWVTMTRDRWYDRPLVILGTYGTLFLVLDLAIHVYFVFSYLLRWVLSLFRECPHCHSGPGRWGGHPAMAEYTPFTDADAVLYAESDAGAGESDAGAVEAVTTEQA